MLGEVRGSESRLLRVNPFSLNVCKYPHKNIANERVWLIYRCMASSLVRTGFVRGSMTQGNGCYQHRCRNNLLEVRLLYLLPSPKVSFFFLLSIRCYNWTAAQKQHKS